ncbi:hypothetical protein DJ521_01755, partial [Sulfolobus sp. E3]
ILGYPQYSNVYFPSLAWGPSALFGVGIMMFIIMNLFLAYVIIRLLKDISIF